MRTKDDRLSNKELPIWVFVNNVACRTTTVKGWRRVTGVCMNKITIRAHGYNNFMLKAREIRKVSYKEERPKSKK